MSNINSVTVGIPVTDLERAIEWYRQLLGEREEMVPMEGIWEIQLTSSFWLQLFQADAEESSLKSINIETDSIEQAHALVSSLGVEAGAIETVPDAVQYFEFSDPFGNLLSFCKTLFDNAE